MVTFLFWLNNPPPPKSDLAEPHVPAITNYKSFLALTFLLNSGTSLLVTLSSERELIFSLERSTHVFSDKIAPSTQFPEQEISK